MPYKWLGIALILAALLAFIGAQKIKVSNLQTALAQSQKMFSDYKGAAAIAADNAEKQARAEEQRRSSELQKAQDEADKKIAEARADAVIATASSGRLQQRINALVAAARAAAQNTTPAASGPPAEDPIGMLADVLKRSSERSRLLAEYADQARAAGEACVQSYSSLTGEAAP